MIIFEWIENQKKKSDLVFIRSIQMFVFVSVLINPKKSEYVSSPANIWHFHQPAKKITFKASWYLNLIFDVCVCLVYDLTITLNFFSIIQTSILYPIDDDDNEHFIYYCLLIINQSTTIYLCLFVWYKCVWFVVVVIIVIHIIIHHCDSW